jgi:hypothetical protein
MPACDWLSGWRPSEPLIGCLLAQRTVAVAPRRAAQLLTLLRRSSPDHAQVSSAAAWMRDRHGRMTPWVYVVLFARRKIWFVKNTTQFFHIGLALVFPIGLFDAESQYDAMVKNKDLTPLPLVQM